MARAPIPPNPPALAVNAPSGMLAFVSLSVVEDS